MTPFPAMDHLAAFLRTPLGLTNIELRRFSGGSETPDEIIVTNRYLLVLEGTLTYRVEQVETTLTAGQQLFVPVWVRRRWSVPAGRFCVLLWCEFVTEHFPSSLQCMLKRDAGAEPLERQALERMHRIWPGHRLQYEQTGLTRDVPGAPEEPVHLLLEAELKASLARFWREAHPVEADASAGAASSEGLHPEIQKAVAWMARNYQNPDALEVFYRELPLSPNHFRILFRRGVGCTLQSYLARLRMRRARFLVHESGLGLKEIAAEVGYPSPHFFFRQYRKFWGHPPGKDRGASNA